jgi:hypothetical protein
MTKVFDKGTKHNGNKSLINKKGELKKNIVHNAAE